MYGKGVPWIDGWQSSTWPYMFDEQPHGFLPIFCLIFCLRQDRRLLSLYEKEGFIKLWGIYVQAMQYCPAQCH
jgi:hypothetical protein